MRTPDRPHAHLNAAVRHTSGAPGHIISLVSTPNYGPVPQVSFGDGDVEVCGWGELELDDTRPAADPGGPHTTYAILDQVARHLTVGDPARHPVETMVEDVARAAEAPPA